MKKVILLLVIVVAVPAKHFAQTAQELAAVKMIHNVYLASDAEEVPAPESFKSKSNLPMEANDAEIDQCISAIRNNLRAKADNMPAGATINGKDPGRINVVILNAQLAGCPGINDMVVKGKWNFVKNQADQNILSKDVQSHERQNSNPIQFEKLNYVVLVDQKEGDTPTKISGVLEISIPGKPKVIELTAADINKEHALGDVKVKLLEMKGSSYKIELSNPSLVKLMPLSASQQEFSSNMTRNIPIVFYNEFAKKPTFSDEEYTAMLKSYDKKDTRLVKLGSVSGTIQKILAYIPEGTITKQIPVELEIKK